MIRSIHISSITICCAAATVEDKARLHRIIHSLRRWLAAIFLLSRTVRLHYPEAYRSPLPLIDTIVITSIYKLYIDAHVQDYICVFCTFFSYVVPWSTAYSFTFKKLGRTSQFNLIQIYCTYIKLYFHVFIITLFYQIFMFLDFCKTLFFNVIFSHCVLHNYTKDNRFIVCKTYLAINWILFLKMTYTTPQSCYYVCGLFSLIDLLYSHHWGSTTAYFSFI